MRLWQAYGKEGSKCVLPKNFNPTRVEPCKDIKLLTTDLKHGSDAVENMPRWLKTESLQNLLRQPQVDGLRQRNNIVSRLAPHSLSSTTNWVGIQRTLAIHPGKHSGEQAETFEMLTCYHRGFRC